MPHDCHALAYVVRAVAANLCLFSVGKRCFVYDFQFSRAVIVLCLHVSKAVYTGDDVRRVLSETVENDAERLFAHFVGGARYAYGAFGGGKAFVSREEGKALRFLREQHFAEVAVAETHLTLVRHGAGNAERLQPYSYVGGGVRCRLCAFFERYGAAEGISPHRVFKGNRLNAFYYGIHVYAVLFADGFRLLNVFETVFAQHAVYFVYSSFIAFKQSHKSQPPFMPFAD